MHDKVEQIIIDNVPLINFCIKRMHLSWKTEDEYQQYYDAGELGLIKGAKAFDENKGMKLSSFLVPCIENGIKHVLYLNTMSKRYNPYGKDLSLNYELEENDHICEFGEFIPDPNIDIEKEIQNKFELERVINAVNNLKNEKDKLALKMYYGLDGYKELGTYEAVAQKMNVTREMIRIRIYRAKEKIKLYLKNNDRDISIIKNKLPRKELKMEKENNLSSLSDLNKMLFKQIEAINDDTKDFEKEIRKSYAISQLAQQIVANTNTCIKAIKLSKENQITDASELKLIGLGK